MSIYKLALSTLLVIGTSAISQIANYTTTEISHTEANQKVLAAGSKNKQKPCPNKPQPKQISHRGSGRVEPEEPNNPSSTSKSWQFQTYQIDLLATAKNDNDSDQPGGDGRRAHRGSGRVEGEQDNNQKSSTQQIFAQSQSDDNNQEAHRGSGRIEA